MGAPFPACSGEKSHDDYVLIYKPETEGDRDHAPDTSFLGLTTKMLTVKGLEGINACYRSEQLEKMAFFQCVEEVEKCFLEESSGEQDSRSGKSQVPEVVWSPGEGQSCLLFSHIKQRPSPSIRWFQILCCHPSCRIKEAL